MPKANQHSSGFKKMDEEKREAEDRVNFRSAFFGTFG
jgi:hypothetical protein